MNKNSSSFKMKLKLNEEQFSRLLTAGVLYAVL